MYFTDVVVVLVNDHLCTFILLGCFNAILSWCVPFLQVPTILFVEILWSMNMHWFSSCASLQTICVRKVIHVTRELYWSLFQNFLRMLGALLCACLCWFFPLPSSGYLAFPDALGIPRYCQVFITGLYCFSATLSADTLLCYCYQLTLFRLSSLIKVGSIWQLGTVEGELCSLREQMAEM